MKVGPTVGLLSVIAIITACVVWFGITATQHVHRSSIAKATTLQAQAATQTNKAVSPTQVRTAPPFHFYSPLHDPPPIATPAERGRWSMHLRTLELEDITPDLAGPPLASVYVKEAAKADKGDVQAATLLFEGLNYCNMETQRSLDDKQAFELTLDRMRRTDTNRYSNHTANLDADVARTRQLYHYCAGLNTRYITMAHWALIAKRSGNPAILEWTEDYGNDFFQKTRHMSVAAREVYLQKAQKKFRIMTEQAAAAGVPRAWMELWVGYYEGDGPYPLGPVRSYASLYTEYMLTKSRALSYLIWEDSQCLNPLQLEEGEALARNSYREIETRSSEVSKATETSLVWPWDSEHLTPKASGIRFNNCVYAVRMSHVD